MQAASLPVFGKKIKLKKIRLAAVRGILLRLGIASLPLVAVILLCLIMFSGLGKSRREATLVPTAPLLPQAQTTQAILVEPAQVVEVTRAARPNLIQAGFRRLGVTHATIHVPD